jgi:hypothetical protein
MPTDALGQPRTRLHKLVYPGKLVVSRGTNAHARGLTAAAERR